MSFRRCKFESVRSLSLFYAYTFTLLRELYCPFLSRQFFEHGDPEQRKELAHELSGQMLTLSLQMYGCRVIQKVCGCRGYINGCLFSASDSWLFKEVNRFWGIHSLIIWQFQILFSVSIVVYFCVDLLCILIKFCTSVGNLCCRILF